MPRAKRNKTESHDDSEHVVATRTEKRLWYEEEERYVDDELTDLARIYLGESDSGNGSDEKSDRVRGTKGTNRPGRYSTE